MARRPSSKAASLRPKAASMKAEHAKSRCITRLGLHDLFLFGAGFAESGARLRFVFYHPRQQTFAKAAARIISSSPQQFLGKLSPSATKARSAAMGSRSASPQNKQTSRPPLPRRILRRDSQRGLIRSSVERPGVGFPVKLNHGAPNLGSEVVRNNGQHAINNGSLLWIAPQG